MPNDTWIPVETRLPTEDGKYLVTENWHGDKIVSMKRFTLHMSKHVDVRLPDHTDEKGWYDYDHTLGMIEAGYVTAWQPLPEAYDAEDDKFTIVQNAIKQGDGNEKKTTDRNHSRLERLFK